MRVVMVSDQETFGGAAIAAARLAEGLSSEGHEVLRVVEQADGSDHGWTSIRWGDEMPLRQKVMARARLGGRDLFERRAARELARVLGRLGPDVVNLHNLHSASGSGWSPLMLQAAAAVAPVVWTLHDMWSFTGRCAYNYTCRKFLTGCDETCPTPFEIPVLDADKIAAAWASRRSIFASNDGLRAVAPSRWLASEASAGFWGPERVSLTPYGVPLDVFRPMERAEARDALGLPKDVFLLLVAAQDLSDRRKGVAVLETALGYVEEPLGVVALGSGGALRTGDNLDVHALGYVDDDERKALAFNAVDAVVHPAIADNLPNVVLEALACGTPVIGFPVGGVVDMVRPGGTGWLARDVSAEGLAAAIEDAMREGAPDDLKARCRRVAEDEYGQQKQARAYLRLFERLIGSAHLPLGTTPV